MKRRVQIFIEHDIIIRHFVHSGALRHVEEVFDVQYVFPLKNKRVMVDPCSLGLESVVRISVDAKRIKALRTLGKMNAIRQGHKKKQYSWVDEFYRFVFPDENYDKIRSRALSFWFFYYKWKLLRRAGVFSEMSEAIDAFCPDVILHPSVLEGLFVCDLSMLCRKKKIPLVVLMNSWDNPSSKAQVTALPDWLVVWGEQTRRHAVDFLGFRPEQVKILGAAQLEVYKSPPEKSREDICREQNVSVEKKLIVYAGSSKSVNEIKYLRALDAAVESGLLNNCNIVFRPHPWRAPAEDEPDFFDIEWKHLSMDSSMKKNFNRPGAGAKINLSNYMDTHNLLSAADLLVSNVSTILLEGAMHGKPVLCMVSEEDIASSDFLRVIYKSIFFQELLNEMKIPVCRTAEDLPLQCRRLLEAARDESFWLAQKERIGFFIDQSEGSYGRKLCDFIGELADQH